MTAGRSIVEKKSKPPVHHRVTMKEVAERCGVSLSTVSLVLSGDERISAPTTQQVLSVVKSMGYRPNVIARSLARQQTKNLGVILPDAGAALDPSFVTEAIRAVYSEAALRGYRVLMEVATPRFLARRYYLRVLKENAVDGVIYVGARLQDDFLLDPEVAEFPFVLLEGRLNGGALSSVRVDSEGAGRQATSYLLELGHTAVGHLAGDPAYSWAEDRTVGYRRAMSEAGVSSKPEWIQPAHESAEQAKMSTQALLDAGVTAIFAANDFIAACALQAVRSSGRSVPEDVSIIGMGDSAVAQLMDPGLSSVRYDIRSLVQDGTRRIMQRIEEGRAEMFHVTQPSEIVARGSTASTSLRAVRSTR